jgi:ATP-binding cassette subfamily B (MDR/TAP) protein 1
MEFQKGLTEENKDELSQANLLCGDCIMNYKTVQSMGYEEKIIAKYKEYLQPGIDSAMKKHCKAGAAFGFGQFMVFAVFAAAFLFGGLLIEANFDEKTGKYGVNPENIMMTIFVVLFGASQAGSAMSLGPDIGKAGTAAENIFRIIEYPSKINAIEQNKKPEFVSADNIKGVIEFKDVWFRYPTRKEDFVLRGLNVLINPNESVALVGESGCGKSTFVSLLMRFYDVDFGEILIDGVNIKKYNLHSLRKKISLVM